MKHIRRTRATAQALVEFALAATLIFFLLAAAVDLGLIYMTVQALHNAAQEGANYGSRWLKIESDGRSHVDEAKVRERVRNESGPSGGVSGINLKDLNADGTPDDQQPGVLDNNIKVRVLTDVSEDGDPTKNVASGADEDVECADPSLSLKPCYVWVKVTATYRAFFPFATVFGASRDLSSTYIIPIRNAYTRTAGRGTMVPATQYVPPTPITDLDISLLRYIKVNGNNPLTVVVKVSKGGIAVPGAVVNITVNGVSYSLFDRGGGIYANCGIGSFGGSSSPGGLISASDGSASGSMPVNANTGTGAGYACP